MAAAPSQKPRVTPADPHLLEAVAAALKIHRDANDLNDAQLAQLLGVSKPTLSKYLNRKQLIGGGALLRAIADLGIAISYHKKQVSAQDLGSSPSQAASRQISFVFEQPCLFEETPGQIAVTIERKQPEQSRTIVQLKVAV